MLANKHVSYESFWLKFWFPIFTSCSWPCHGFPKIRFHITGVHWVRVHRTLTQTFDHLFFEQISLRQTGRRDESLFRCFWDLIWDNNVEIQWLIFTGKCAKCETVILPTNFSKLKISQIILAGKLMEQIREVHHIFVYV